MIIWDWLKKKWKALLAFIALVFGALTLYMRSKNQKKILKQANDSHEKENKANEKALKDLKDGLQEIRKNEKQDREVIDRKHEEKNKNLEEEKRATVEAAKSDKDLAKKIADELGVDFVDTNKK